jgi:8-oxo-dGTP diphosphatase
MVETGYPKPDVTVDVVLMTVSGGALCVLLAPRARSPHAGLLALPGAYVHVDEDRDSADTARRLLREKVGIVPPYLAKLGFYDGRLRDERGWSTCNAYYALVHEEHLRGPDAFGSVLVPVDQVSGLAQPGGGGVGLPFDHEEIVADAASRVRRTSAYSSMPLFLLPDEFTFKNMQEMYQTVLGGHLDPATFRRKVKLEGLVEEVPDVVIPSSGRPSRLYRKAEPVLRTFDRNF